MADTKALRAFVPKGRESSTLSRGTRGIAQLVERAVWDREVGGSSPLSPTQAGLVDRLNICFPSKKEGFDSPIPLTKDQEEF